MIELQTLSANQRAVMSHAVSDDTACFAGGAIRSGKTTAAMYGFGLWLLKEGMHSQHAIIGHSLETSMRNVGWPFMDVLEGFGVRPRLSRDIGARISVAYAGRETSVWLVAANDERALKRLQGATLKGLFIDEAVLVPESFFTVAWGRLSVAGAKLWATYNPDNPRHWFKTKVLDRADAYRGRVISFAMRDNPSLADEVIERYDASFVGHWHARMILGQWAGASGLIFPVWHAIEDPLKHARHVIALDWGVSSVFAALAIRARGPRADVFAELYHDGREAGARGEDEHLAALASWARETFGDVRGTVVWLDPATPVTFKRALSKAGFVVRNGDNDVLPGLVTTATRLSRGEIRIGDCPNLRRELVSYQWNQDKSEQGEDVPVKSNDHCCDALRYYAHSTGKAFRLAELTPAAHALPH